MATIADVAREAGVSRSTVSSVLTGRKFVAPSTRERIEAAIAKLDFAVNAGARALATARTMTIGVMVRFHEAEFSPALAAYLVALSDAANDAGYTVTLLTQRESEAAARAVIAGRQVDGLVLLNVVEDDPRLEPIAAANYPAVLIGVPDATHGIDAVDLDFAGAGGLLIDLLAERGHAAATLLGWPRDLYDSGATYARRFADAVDARAAEHGMTITRQYLPVAPDDVRAELRRLLSAGDRPRSLIVHNDAAVALLPQVLHELDLHSPDDISITSLHSAELTQLFGLPFTCVESRPQTVSATAIELLLGRMSSPASAPRVRLIDPVITERRTIS